ncbi:DNA polymerase subunit Cdc27 [Niveomyces insectorum RCEF 264]|uniref:DNA polymerase delta subunit 3 n=1 Tax=Niveomyces insectorum RCEF 264 TaxID=1081102 RepID=A0A168A706_9HYPO|nr:DNA polymerase subunit Cdc27 [Niveomyces insectorum RCEF 264]
MDKVKEFLAEEVLVENRVVTYRYLSRALKLRVNVAKKALYDFHTSQNAKKPNSLHATYLLYGTKPAEERTRPQNGQQQGGDDVDMDDDSHFDDQPSEQVPTLFLTLVSEENLKDALAKYETLEAIHVYSVSSQPMSDLQVLADSTSQLRELRGGSLEEVAQTYGTIPNTHMRRRQRKGQTIPFPESATAPSSKTPSAKEDAKRKGPPAPTSSSAKPAQEDVAGPTAFFNRAPKAKADTTSAKSGIESEATASASASEGAEPKKATAPPALKRAASSGGGGIMEAFAKGAAAAKPKRKESAQLSKKQTTTMDDTATPSMSDDGGDDDVDVLPKARQVAGGLSRKQREEELRKMMEEEDDNGHDEESQDDEKDEDEREDTPMEDADEPPPPPTEAEAAAAAKADEPSEVVSASSGSGRRRGKRRVMRKKMIEDENGYLVTIQEPVWESFSEDEAPPKSAQPVAAKAKKPAAKPGQGNIMSFFSKK